MTRIVYDDPITFETNGDCSSITLNFPPGTEEAVKELRKKLKDQGFVVQDHSINDNMIRLHPGGTKLYNIERSKL